MGHSIKEILTGTAKIDPGEFSAQTSSSRVASLGYALAGCGYMLRRQKNTRIQAAATLVVAGLAGWLRIGRTDWALLVLMMTLVWLAEFLNAAIEATINLIAPEFHPMAKVGKDVAAAAVLLSVIASVVIGLLVLGPPLLERFGG